MTGSAPAALQSTPTRAQRLSELGQVALSMALATGIAQVTLQLTNLAARDRLVFMSRDVVWMAPAAYVVLFGVIALCLAVLALVRPLLVPLPLTLFVFGFVAVFSLLLPISAIARWAEAMVAAGIGVQLARAVSQAPERWLSRMRRASVVMILLVAVAGTAGSAWRAIAERRAVAALPAATDGAPNVLLIILDTVRAASLGLHGYTRDTAPQLSAVAKEGVTFDRAYSTAPWTLPSHASMFTGRYPDELTADFLRRLDRSQPTLAEAFAAHGYLTAGFMANEFYTAWDSGIDRGFQRWEDYRVSWNQTMLSAWLAQVTVVRELRLARTIERARGVIREFNLELPVTLAFDEKHSGVVRNDFLGWHATVQGAGSRPFFAVLNLFDAHRPRYSPAAFRTRFTPTPKGPDFYDNAIAYMDDEVGKLLTTLRARGVLDRTIVVITADHGELLGEHKLYGHSTNLYRQALHVPLVIRAPGRLPPGGRVADPVSLRDLAATILDLSDMGGRAMPGVSLVPLALGPDSVSAAPSSVRSLVSQGINLGANYPSSLGPMQSVIDGSMHLIRNGDATEELYDLAADPGEANDLIASPGAAARAAALRALLAPAKR
jgi:arylsulfatase A-like enzyme